MNWRNSHPVAFRSGGEDRAGRGGINDHEPANRAESLTEGVAEVGEMPTKNASQIHLAMCRANVQAAVQVYCGAVVCVGDEEVIKQLWSVPVSTITGPECIIDCERFAAADRQNKAAVKWKRFRHLSCRIPVCRRAGARDLWWPTL